MVGQNLITQRDVIKKPQFVVEGITPATYAISPTNPVFTSIGRDSTLVENPAPVKAELREVPNVDKQRNDLTSEVNTVSLKFKAVDADKALLIWLFNVPNGTGTPDESRTFMWSYDNNAGVETFQQFFGCQPLDTSITIDREGYIVIEASLTCKQILEDVTGPTIGSGSFATDPTGTPLIHLDAGTAPFTYNSLVTEIQNFTISTAFTYAEQDSLASSRKLYSKPTMRVNTGSSVIFKQNLSIQDDAKTVTERAATFILSSGSITFTFSGFLFIPSGEEISGDVSNATMENKSWESNEVIIS